MTRNIEFGCNTIDASGITGGNGIVVEQDALLIDQGDANTPAGNKFTGLDVDLFNDNVPLVYYKGFFEVDPITGGNGSVELETSTSEPNCSSQYGTGNGKLVARKAVESIHDKQDSVRYQLGDFITQKRTQEAVIAYYSERNKLNKLRDWMQTLPSCNLEAYNTISMYLMHAYKREGKLGKAESCKQGMITHNPNDEEIACRIAFFDFEDKLQSRSLIEEYSFVDSTKLADIAHSGTSLAKEAHFYLTLAYPGYSCSTTYTYQFTNVTCETPEGLFKKATDAAHELAELGDAIPNPANGETYIPYNVPLGEAVLLVVRDALRGEIMTQLNIHERGEGYVRIDLSNLSSGIYWYTLAVDGRPVETKKFILTE